MHIHASALDALTFTAYLIIIGTLLRVIASKFNDRPIGRALAFAY